MNAEAEGARSAWESGPSEMRRARAKRWRRRRRQDAAQGGAGQKEMLMPIEGKKPKEVPAKKPAARPQRKSA